MIRCVATLLAVLLLAPAFARPALADEPKRVVEFVITDERITDSSGLATDPVNQVYWTINDSGPAVVYALDKRGRTVGTLRYDAEPFDVESISYSKGRLYVGATGGNRAPRTTITVYVFDNPRPDGSKQSFQELRFTYPDGPHDTEAMLVNSQGRIVFVSKGAQGGEIFTAPADLSATRPNALTKVGSAPQYVTDGTVLTDGRMILRSYVAVFEIDPQSYDVVAGAATPPLKQGESVTQPLAGNGLLIGTEGENSEVLRVPVPMSMQRIPTIVPPTQPENSPAPPSTSPAVLPPESSGLQMLPYIAGGGVAIAIVVTVLFWRRRRGSNDR